MVFQDLTQSEHFYRYDSICITRFLFKAITFQVFDLRNSGSLNTTETQPQNTLFAYVL